MGFLLVRYIVSCLIFRTLTNQRQELLMDKEKNSAANLAKDGKPFDPQ